MENNKDLLQNLKLEDIKTSKLKNINLGKLKLSKIDSKTVSDFLLITFLNRISKQHSNCHCNMPYPGPYGMPYPYNAPMSPYPAQQPAPQIIMLPGSGGGGGYSGGGGFSGSADDIKEYIYNQTMDYRNAYEQNMRYISDEFEEIKRMINRR